MSYKIEVKYTNESTEEVIINDGALEWITKPVTLPVSEKAKECHCLNRLNEWMTTNNILSIEIKKV